MSYTVYTEALRADARLWDGVADTTEVAAAAAESLSVAPSSFSFVGRDIGMADTYALIQAKVARLMHEATRSCTDLAAELRRVAETYEFADDDAVARMAESWKPMEE